MKNMEAKSSVIQLSGLSLNTRPIIWAALVASLTLAILASGIANAQTPSFVTPGKNTNIVGVTPDPSHKPDYGLKQQQEPSCIVRPTNGSYILCGYNDLRGADDPDVGDSWIGVSMSDDAGQTWNSRLAPGFLGHENSIGQGFAADPGLVAIPGNSPGLAIMSYIAGNRGENEGFLVVQRWVENPQEDLKFWVAENQIRVPVSGSGGRFVDKSAILYLPDPIEEQIDITETIVLEDGREIQVTTPSGTIIVFYAVFTGNSTSKIYAILSRSNGAFWSNPTKLSEGNNEVTGVVATAIEKLAVVAWRQRKDSNNDDAIVGVVTTDGGNRWSKKLDFMSVCPFDQPASSFSFRSFDFPWLANDGDRFWLFAADRRYGAANDGSCTEQPSPPNPPGTYSGLPRIVGMTSVNGKNWVGTVENKDVPFVLDDKLVGFQYMPASWGTKGWVDVAYYNTEREEPLPDQSLNLFPDLVTDYVTEGGLARVTRKTDVYMTRLRSVGCGSQANTGCNVDIEPAVRISQYDFNLTGVANIGGNIVDVGEETESNKPNLPLYASGTLAFKGDYIAIATPGLRQLASGEWIQNSYKEGAKGLEQTGFLNSEDVFVAWGDNRDWRGDFVQGQMPYTPPAAPNPSATGNTSIKRLNPAEPESSETLLAESGQSDDTMKAVTEPDDDPMQVPDTSITTCNVADFSNARNANVYGVLVKDEPTLFSPTLLKPQGTIQRMFPIQLNNPGVTPQNYCLVIVNQPPDEPINGRASFFQLPAIPPFDGAPLPVIGLDVGVLPGSTESRAVFVVTGDASTVIKVNAYKGTCSAPTGLVGTVQLADGDLFDPEYCSVIPLPEERVAACQSVADHETHNIDLVASGLQSEVLLAPGFQAVAGGAVTYTSPGFQAPGFQAPGFQFPGFQAPGFQFPGFQAQTYSTPGFQAPGFQFPGFQAPGFQAATFGDEDDPNNTNPIVYQDVTFVVAADANVTTTYSTDIALNGLDPDETVVQLVAWTPNAYTTAEGCQTVATADQQIISHNTLLAAPGFQFPGFQAPGFQFPGFQALALPETITPAQQDPYAGAISFMQKSGTYTAITARIWAVGSAREVLLDKFDEYNECVAMAEVDPESCDPANAGINKNITLGASSQSCNTNALGGSGDCLDTEKIFQDRFGPEISPSDGEAIAFEANGPLGAEISTPDGIPTVTGPGGESIPLVTAEDPAGVASLTCTSDDFELVNGTSTVPLSEVDPVTGELVPATIDCVATDELNNEATASIGLNVIDTEAPTLSASLSILNIEANTYSDLTVGAYVDYTTANQVFTATDNVAYPGGVAGVVPDCSLVSGTFVAAGSLTLPNVIEVTCDIDDFGPNATGGVNTSNQVTFDVSVVDSVAPVFTLVPAAISKDAEGLTTEVNIGMATATDILSPTITATATGIILPAVITSDVIADFPLGQTDVTWRATDTVGNYVETVQVVTITNLTAPVPNAPADITTEATAEFTPVNIGTATSDDPLNDTIENDAPDPAEFPVGSTTVRWTATDVSGNVTWADQIITITDSAAPSITPLNLSYTTLGTTANVDYLADISATDIADPDPVLSCDLESPYEFPTGVTDVTCTATDDSDNETTLVIPVTVSFQWLIDVDRFKGRITAGSAVPVRFRYLDPDNNNQPVDSSGLSPVASWTGPHGEGCTGPSGGNDGEDPGESSYRFEYPDWLFNWQTPEEPGWYIFTITPPGLAGWYDCVRTR